MGTGEGRSPLETWISARVRKLKETSLKSAKPPTGSVLFRVSRVAERGSLPLKLFLVFPAYRRRGEDFKR